MILDPTTGEPMISVEEMAPLLGVSSQQVRDWGKTFGTGVGALPKTWIQQGRRRAREYMAATGCTDMQGAIEYWRERDAS